MLRRTSLFVIAVLLFAACNIGRQQPNPNTLLNTDKLPTSEITIDISQENTLRTTKGAIIHIPAGAIDSDTDRVTIMIQEAYTMQEMIQGGLTTKTNGIPLSSGGMIYIDTKEQSSVRRPIKVYLPTTNQQKGMQLYKGFKDISGEINWNDPMPINDTPYQTIVDGERLFKKQCASCHHPTKQKIGPELAIVAVNRDRQWLDNFIYNPAAMIAKGDPYANYIYNIWHKAPMTAFPNFTEKEVDAILEYLKGEAYAAGINTLTDEYYCFEQCQKYIKTKYSLNKKRNELIADNNTNTLTVAPPTNGTTTTTPTVQLQNNMVLPASNNATYYQFTIEAMGWYNIDIVTKDLPGFEESELTVRITGSYQQQIHVYLMIPDRKIFVPGGLMRNSKDQYAFFTNDGKIKLPQGAQAYIMAMAEQNGKVLYGQTSATLTTKQHLEVAMTEISKDDFNKKMAELGTDGLSINVQDSKNADSIRATDQALDNLQAPEDCDCKLLENIYLGQEDNEIETVPSAAPPIW